MGEGPGRKSSAAWPSYLRGETREEIHARLRESDPLRLRERCARRLRELWVLLDPERAFNRTQAFVAEYAVIDDPPADLDAWAASKIDVAIASLVTSDLEAESTRPGILTDEERDFPLLTKSLFIEPDLVRKVSVEFNALPPLPRRAFYELLIEGKTPEACIEAGPWDEDGLYEAIHIALRPFNLDLPATPTHDRPEGKDAKT